MNLIKINTTEIFGINSTIEAEKLEQHELEVPKIIDGYVFDEKTTNAVLAGFKYNKRVIVQGYHGSGKSSHIEQIAARLNWSTYRINLDSNISRIDLIGRDTIKLEDNKQVTKFEHGILPWLIQQPIALILDEYDAGRPDIMFVIQRLLEAGGQLSLIETKEIIKPHPLFRIFATCNTIGLGDATGIYHGTNQINQAQLDRWNLIANLDYISEDKEILAISNIFQNIDINIINSAVSLANNTRKAFISSEISTVISTRTIISWLENYNIFGDMMTAFEFSFLNKCDPSEKDLILELYSKSF